TLWRDVPSTASHESARARGPTVAASAGVRGVGCSAATKKRSMLLQSPVRPEDSMRRTRQTYALSDGVRPGSAMPLVQAGRLLLRVFTTRLALEKLVSSLAATWIS